MTVPVDIPYVMAGPQTGSKSPFPGGLRARSPERNVQEVTHDKKEV
jgi:hypothetical protein